MSAKGIVSRDSLPSWRENSFIQNDRNSKKLQKNSKTSQKTYNCALKIFNFFAALAVGSFLIGSVVLLNEFFLELIVIDFAIKIALIAYACSLAFSMILIVASIAKNLICKICKEKSARKKKKISNSNLSQKICNCALAILKISKTLAFSSFLIGSVVLLNEFFLELIVIDFAMKIALVAYGCSLVFSMIFIVTSIAKSLIGKICKSNKKPVSPKKPIKRKAKKKPKTLPRRKKNIPNRTEKNSVFSKKTINKKKQTSKGKVTHLSKRAKNSFIIKDEKEKTKTHKKKKGLSKVKNKSNPKKPIPKKTSPKKPKKIGQKKNIPNTQEKITIPSTPPPFFSTFSII
jgi:hypothetical protein